MEKGGFLYECFARNKTASRNTENKCEGAKKCQIVVWNSDADSIECDCRYVSIPLTPTLKIGFSSVFAGLSGMVYGPLLTGFAGIIADNLKYILRPDGPYFPFFGINEFLTGMIYGAFFYKKKITLPRVIAARACITVLINLILTSLWLNIMYQSPLFTMVRLVKNIVLFPVDVAVLYFLLKAGEKILPKQ